MRQSSDSSSPFRLELKTNDFDACSLQMRINQKIEHSELLHEEIAKSVRDSAFAISKSAFDAQKLIVKERGLTTRNCSCSFSILDLVIIEFKKWKR